jgi:hypothetical protein
MDRAIESVIFCACVVTFMDIFYPLRADKDFFLNFRVFCVMGINLLDACVGVL